MSDLKKRVLQFKTLQLPGQPMVMHMGTANLVDDLLAENEALKNRECTCSYEDCKDSHGMRHWMTFCPYCGGKIVEVKDD